MMRKGYSRRHLLASGLAAGLSAVLAGCSDRTEEVGVIRDRTVTDADEGTPDETFGTIQAAVDAATAGDTVTVPSGTYRERLTTARSGTADEPITIVGPESAIVRGARGDYGIVRINHSHIHLRGLTIEGLLTPDQPDRLASYVSGQLVQTRPPLSTDDYLRDIVVAPHAIGYSRRSLVGLERTVDAEIGPCRISGLAGAAYQLGGEESRNGELFYIGTSHSNLGADWHPWTDLDETRAVRIHHIDNSEGHPHAMAVDLKEGTRNVTVEYLTDRNAGHVGTDETPGAISFKSQDSTVRWCDIADSPFGVEFAPATDEQPVAGNDIYGCRIGNIERESVIMRSDTPIVDDQGVVCGNRIEGFDGPQPAACPSDIPTSETVGHATTETNDERESLVTRRPM
ncbi:MAG: hypothetical protein R6V31_08575 [Halohasta sp.]